MRSSGQCSTTGLLAAVAILSLTPRLGAQSAGSYARLGREAGKDVIQPEGASPSNPYAVGLQLGYTFAGGGDFSNDLIASGLLKLTPTNGRHWNLHLFGNISDIKATVLAGPDEIKTKLREVINSARGLDGRVYVEWAGSGLTAVRKTQLVAWSSLGVRVNAAKADANADPTYISQLRGSFGIELRIAISDTAPQPVTLSVEGWAGRLLGNSSMALLDLSGRTNLSIEPTVVIPLAIFNSLRSGFGQNVAILGQAVIGANNDLPRYFRAGFLVAKAGKSKSE